MGDAGPLVSVIIPAFNAESTIAETLRSALAQTWREIEIIVADDGSTDRTAEIVAVFARADDKVKLVRGAKGGPSAARNRAIAAARGEYIAPLDADDLWHPAKIELQLKALLAAPEPPGFVYSHFRLIDGEGGVVGTGAQYACRGHVLHRIAYRFFIGNGSSTLFSRAALLEAGGYDERLGNSDDYLLHLRIARRHPVEVVRRHLVGYRIRPGSLSSDQEKVFEGWRTASALFRQECGDVPARIWAWASAKQRFNLGISRILRRRWGSGSALLAQALWLDPARTLHGLWSMLARRARRRLASAPPPRAPISFGSFGEDEETPATLRETQRGAAWPDRFERRRFERLADLDARRQCRSRR